MVVVINSRIHRLNGNDFLQKTAEESNKVSEIRKDENGFKMFPYWICQPNIRTASGNSKKEKEETIESDIISVTLQRE